MKVTTKIDRGHSPMLREGITVGVTNPGCTHSSHSRGMEFPRWVGGTPSKFSKGTIIGSFFCSANEYWIYAVSIDDKSYLINADGIEPMAPTVKLEEELFTI